MSCEVDVTWKIDRETSFEIEEFAKGALEIAAENLVKDGYLIPVAFVITATEIFCHHLRFELEQKHFAYEKLAGFARDNGAKAIVTVNDAYWSVGGNLQEYYQGKLRDDGEQECLMLTVSGPGIVSWCIDVNYKRQDGQFIFSDPTYKKGEHIGMLGDWADNTKSVN